VGEHFSTFYTEEDCSAGVPGENLAAAADQGSVEDEGWRVRADGSRFWADVTIAAIRDSDGELDGYAKITRDMTEQREHEEQLREERDFTEQILDTAPASIFVIDATGDVVLANERLAEKLGMDDVTGELSVGDLTLLDETGDPIPPDERPYRTSFETGEAVTDWQCQVELSSGDRRWVSLNLTPIPDGNGGVERVVVAAQDVTPLREQAERLERQRDEIENELAEIFDRVDEAYFTLDEDWRITYVNDRAAELVRLSAGELLGSRVWDVLPEVADGYPREMAEEAMANQESVEFEFYSEMLDIWVGVRGYPSESGMSVYFRDITERQERERALKESERRYRTLIENFPGGAVGLFDEELRYTAAGGQLLETENVDPEERIGRSIFELYPEDLVTEVEPYFQAALEGEANSFEAEYRGRHLFNQTLPVRNANDEVYAGMLVVQDDTERREIQRELRESEAKFRMLAENLEEIVWMATPDADEFIYVNPAFEEVWGIDRDTLYDEPLSFLDAVHEEDRERVRKAFTQLPEEEFDDEYRIVRPDGEVRWIHARGTTVEDEEGDMVRIMGIGEDITERVERDRELERALDLLEKTERIADVGGWEIDVNTTDVFWTDHVFDLLEVTSDEEPPLDEALDMYHEEDQPIVEDAVENALDSGDSFDVEVRLRTDSSEVRWLRLQGVPETVDDEVVSFRGAAQDITERKQREQRLKELIDRLEESNERLKQFAYAASHDLQEPLRMVSSYLQLIEQQYSDALDEDGEEFLEFAVDGADRMRDMIDGLLKYSRVETQGDPLRPVDLDAVFEDVLEDLQVRIEESDADITAEELPRVEGDAGQLRQVFQNLLKNAIEYSGDGPPRVHVSAERDGTERIISVSDEGIGIDPDEADRIFEVFQSLHDPADHSGTGIGLALSERIVERHGGRIWVESEPGEGAPVSFTLSEAGDDDE
jgi:PAS domain S-box-containing protein